MAQSAKQQTVEPAMVSIVLRTKDRPRFLRRALCDVQAQTCQSWELIVVNDGGDEEVVRQIVAEVLPGDRRVRVLSTAGEGGRCRAANDGIREATAEFIILHDDDDYWDPDFLSVAAGWLGEHPDFAGVALRTMIVYESFVDGQYREIRRAPFWESLTEIRYIDMLEVNRVVPIGFLYRRSLHAQYGYYDETLDAVEDWEFYLKVYQSEEVGFLPEHPLAFWTQRPGVSGADGNSMFLLAEAHARDDKYVRDQQLRTFSNEFGSGLPLYVSYVVNSALERQYEQFIKALDDRRPLRRRLRKLMRRALGRGHQ